MPAYAFKCKSCDEQVIENCEYEDLNPSPPCPKCFLTMVRDYRFGAIQFKGPGFNVTDG